MGIIFGSPEANAILEKDRKIRAAEQRAEKEAEDESNYPHWLVRVPQYHWYRVRAMDEEQAIARAEEEGQQGGGAVEYMGEDDLEEFGEATAEREQAKDAPKPPPPSPPSPPLAPPTPPAMPPPTPPAMPPTPVSATGR
jgi:hypothetical protein